MILMKKTIFNKQVNVQRLQSVLKWFKSCLKAIGWFPGWWNLVYFGTGLVVSLVIFWNKIPPYDEYKELLPKFVHSVLDGGEGDGWQTIKIATGANEGLYRQASVNIEELMKHSAQPDDELPYVWESVSTVGSKENYELLRDGKVDFAIIQDDFICSVARDAFIKKVTPLFYEELTFFSLNKDWNRVTLKSEWVRILSDISVAVASKDTGSWFTTKKMYDCLKLELPIREYQNLNDVQSDLQTSEIDGFFTVIGHPILIRSDEETSGGSIVSMSTFPKYSTRASLYYRIPKDSVVSRHHELVRKLADELERVFRCSYNDFLKMDPAYSRRNAFIDDDRAGSEKAKPQGK